MMPVIILRYSSLLISKQGYMLTSNAHVSHNALTTATPCICILLHQRAKMTCRDIQCPRSFYALLLPINIHPLRPLEYLSTPRQHRRRSSRHAKRRICPLRARPASK